jgi:hypothetical protein
LLPGVKVQIHDIEIKPSIDGSHIWNFLIVLMSSSMAMTLNNAIDDSGREFINEFG